MTSLKGQSGIPQRVTVELERVTYAIPRILIIFPTFVKSNPDLIALTEGQVNVTSPPPSGGCPLLVIY